MAIPFGYLSTFMNSGKLVLIRCFHSFLSTRDILIFQISKSLWDIDMFAFMLSGPLFPQEHHDVDS